MNLASELKKEIERNKPDLNKWYNTVVKPAFVKSGKTVQSFEDTTWQVDGQRISLAEVTQFLTTNGFNVRHHSHRNESYIEVTIP